MMDKFIGKKNLVRLFLVMLTILLSMFVFQGVAYSIPTKWEKVDSSLSDLLNSGWLLQGTDYSRVAYQNSISPGGLDEENYTFTLAKNGKYIICSVGNPRTPIAQVAGCRRIN
jgi:outer membrane lipoprotein-sorting protein